ncbi:hypothetical protein Dimus_010017 [Dionaea muscipula]
MHSSESVPSSSPGGFSSTPSAGSSNRNKATVTTQPTTKNKDTSTTENRVRVASAPATNQQPDFSVVSSSGAPSPSPSVAVFHYNPSSSCAQTVLASVPPTSNTTGQIPHSSLAHCNPAPILVSGDSTVDELNESTGITNVHNCPVIENTGAVGGSHVDVGNHLAVVSHVNGSNDIVGDCTVPHEGEISTSNESTGITNVHNCPVIENIETVGGSHVDVGNHLAIVSHVDGSNDIVGSRS